MQGREPGVLRGRAGAGVGVDLQLGDLLGEGLGHDAVAEAPAGHRVGLREAVEDDRAPVGPSPGSEAMLANSAVVEQPGVDLVAEDEDVGALAQDVGERGDVLRP